MTDTKALFTERFDAARTAWTHGDEPAAAESLRWAIVAARSDPSLRRELASALFHRGKLSRKLGQAGEAEAGPLLSEALAISEKLFGSEDAALAPVLHELSRLYVQQSQHARAEGALGRLLAIARVKGDEHPDVAAALVDLAFVKRKLGDDASAEALYRDALRIREKVLEPNHTITVGTLERLSETCAARGNFAEALALLYRALPTREAALGADHERVRAMRSRIAELESQIAIVADAEAAAPPWTTRDVVDTPSTHAPSAVNSKDLEFDAEPQLRVRRPAGRPPERAMTPVVAAPVAAPSFMASSILTLSASEIVVSSPESTHPSGSDVALGDVALGDWRSTVALVHADSSEPARRKRTVQYASAGVAAVAIAIVGLLMLRPRVGSGRALVSTEMSAAQRTTAAGALVVTAPAKRTVSIGTGAAGMVAAAHADSFRAASTAPVPATAVIQREQRAPETALPEFRAPRVKVHLDSINIPSMSAALSGEAILRSAMERQRASDTNRTETRDELSRPTPADVDHAHTAPRIMGRPPEPAFPDALLRSGAREGQVVVRFMVDELGRVDVASVVVERSDHELFTEAVRDVLARFRFEPAYTLGPVSKPVAAWVSVPFRFTTKKR
jgi:TonB family protein